MHGSKTLKPLSVKTILKYHRLLRAMLHKTVYWQIIIYNPAERVQPLKAKKPKRKYSDNEQCKFLLEHLTELCKEQIKYKVAIILTIFTGVRLSKLMKLEWFVKYIEQIGLPVINFHGFWHTSATLLIAQNIDVAVVAARLVHAQITITYNFYMHTIISHNKPAGNALENLLLPSKLV